MSRETASTNWAKWASSTRHVHLSFLEGLDGRRLNKDGYVTLGTLIEYLGERQKDGDFYGRQRIGAEELVIGRSPEMGSITSELESIRNSILKDQLPITISIAVEGLIKLAGKCCRLESFLGLQTDVENWF